MKYLHDFGKTKITVYKHNVALFWKAILLSITIKTSIFAKKNKKITAKIANQSF